MTSSYQSKNIAIIGGGIIGVTSALRLAKLGYNITIIDRQDSIAKECSYANGGQLSVCNCESWLTYNNVYKAIIYKLKKNPAIDIGSMFYCEKFLWLANFFKNIILNKHIFTTKKLISYAIKSRELFEEILKEETIDFNYQKKGILSIYSDTRSFNKAIAFNSKLAKTGFNREILTPNDINKLDSSINLDNIKGGLYSIDDSSGDMYKFIKALVQILIDRYALKTIFNCEIKKIISVKDKYELIGNNNKNLVFDKVIIAAGCGTNLLAKDYYRTDIYPVKGYSVTINLSKQSTPNAAKIAMLDEKYRIATSKLGSRFRVAGTANWYGYDDSIDVKKIKFLLDWIKMRYPTINTKDYDSWACLRPMTSNMLPITKEIKPNLYINSGSGHLGWTIAMALADDLVKVISKSNKKIS